MAKIFPPEGYLSIPQASRRLGCGESTLYKWIDEGKLQGEEFLRYPASTWMAQAVSIAEVERYELVLKHAKENPKPAKQYPMHRRAQEDFARFRI